MRNFDDAEQPTDTRHTRQGDTRQGGLLAWQWALYAQVHKDRRNLVLHALTAPLFMAGTAALAASPLGGLRSGVAGAFAMVLAMVLQGRGHKLEGAPPAPFRGPFDVLARIFCEQWVTFPRFVLSGGFAAAWRSART
jgi:hypothetical protein